MLKKIFSLCIVICLLSNSAVFAISTSTTNDEFNVIGAPSGSMAITALYDEENRLINIDTNQEIEEGRLVVAFDNDFKEDMKTAHSLKSFLWDSDNLSPLIDKKEHIRKITSSNLTWKNDSCYDTTGAVVGTNHPRRLMEEEYIRVNPGDRIRLTDDNYVFILYGYKPGTTEWTGSTTNHYIDANPNDSTSNIENWGKDFTFPTDLYYGEGKNNKVEYPLDIRMVIKHKNDITTATNVDTSIKDIVEFDIKTDNPKLCRLSGSLPTLNIADLTWENNSSIYDYTGEIVTPNPANSRVAMTSYIKVQQGDRINLNDSKYKFILYGYTGEDKAFTVNHYIDTNPEDSTSGMKNWGNDFTFTKGLKFGNGDSVTYPLYIRFTVRDAITNNGQLSLTDVWDSFEFDIAADNSHLKPVVYPPSTLGIAEGFKKQNLVSHRGISTAPENTLVAFQESIDLGYTIFEADVRMTSDNVPVLLHDDSIDRTSNGSGAINSMTLATAETYDFGSWKNQKYAGEKIPTLQEFLKFCKERGMMCELDLANRNFTDEQIRIIYNTVKNEEMLGSTIFTATNTELRKYISIDYDIIVSVSGIASISDAKNLLPTYKHCAMVFASVYFPYMNKELIDYVHSQNMKVKVYTINNSDMTAFNNAKTWGVDLVLTDDLPPTTL